MADSCVDCPPGSRRPARRPGPRCATHQRERRNAARTRTWAVHILRTYGISAFDYGRIYEYQNRRCAICQRATGKVRRLSVDHCHKTGVVRGELCRPCNVMLGHARDDREFFIRAIDYLDSPPAIRAIGVRKVPE